MQKQYKKMLLTYYESGSFRPDYLFAPGRFALGRFAPESESIRPT